MMMWWKTIEDIDKTTIEILQLCRQHNLYLNPEKCHFHQEQVAYLGLQISHNQVKMDPTKVKGVVEWPVPKTKKELQAFLGFINFYRRFIQDFARIAKPLHHLTGNVDWTWAVEQQTAFDALKTAITTAPVLRMPTDDGKYRVECDSSDFATGAILSQEQDGKWWPIAYQSKALGETERNYPIFDKELLAVIRALDEWRHHLEGAQQRFEILTDHKNLEYFKTAQKLNRRQARWSLFLSRFDFTLTHRAGKSSDKPDALSRRPDHKPEGEDNLDQVLLKPQWFARAASAQGHEEVEGVGKFPCSMSQREVEAR